MNKIDYRIPGTKLPKLPNDIEFKTLFWYGFKHDRFCFNKIKDCTLISYGYIKHENEDCILVEKENYDGKNYWIFKESDLINLTKDMNKQNNLPKYWVVENTNNDDFKVVLNYLSNTYMEYWTGKDFTYYGYDGSAYYNGTNAYHNLENFKNNPTVLTLEQFKKAIGIEEEFVLPEKWCVKETPEICHWAKQIFGCSNIYFGDRYLCIKRDLYPKFDSYLFLIDKTGYTEITFEQFKKYVLKMENNKKIIEYKVKEQFSKFSEALFSECKNDTKGGFGRFDFDSNVKLFFKEAGVLDLWFEPVYEEEVKTINMGSFNLTVKDKKVFHKNEDITDFVKDMRNYKILQNLGRYTAEIEDITFSATGCKNTPTKLSDWLKVYDMIK